MKIIEVMSCCKCPNHYKICYAGYSNDTPDTFSKYRCRKQDYTLASKSLERIIKPMVVCIPTQSITPGITKMIYSADGKTEWDGSIPMWCPLPNYSPSQFERERVLIALNGDLRTRFISSSNQWSKGRNAGLIECCNIIDELLRQEGNREKHSKDIGNVSKEDMIFTPVRHVDGE